MKIPMQLQFLLENVMRGMGRTAPAGIEILFECEWEMPAKAAVQDAAVLAQNYQLPGVADCVIKGKTPEGATITVLIQVDGLRNPPDALTPFLAVKDA